MADKPDFDPNLDSKTPMLPSAMGLGLPGVTDAETYALAFERAFSDTAGDFISKVLKNPEAAKALTAPPSMMSFGRMSYMPDPASRDGSILQWPGIAPEAIKKIVRENLAPQLIIGMRVDDVMRYSQLSTQAWQPGWAIVPLVPDEKANDASKKDVREAERFLMNCNIETSNAQARKRDAKKLTNFQRFLSALVRDTLTYDGIALWTDMDGVDRVIEFSLAPANQIRLTHKGYEKDPDIFAVAVDQGGTVIHKFTRDELTFYIRNPRTDSESFGYGLSEVEMAVRLVQGFQNALDLNVDTFNRSAIPNGILVLSGSSVTQRQLDLLNRMWTNLKKGITKAWSLPVIGLSENSKLEVLDLSQMKGMEAYYKDFMNMLMGALCTVYRFPVTRLGYRISGHGKDTEPPPDQSTEIAGADDPGLAPLLIHIENVINEYLVWSRWPHLKFVFYAKQPKEDLRRYEDTTLARTWKEQRTEVGLPSLAEIAKKVEAGEFKEEVAKMAALMELCPVDPAKIGAFQSVLTQVVEAPGSGEEGAVGGNKEPGARMSRKIDPVRSEAHGGKTGVRRNSRREKGKGPR